MTGRRLSARTCRCPTSPPEREARIVRELAAQLEDFYRRRWRAAPPTPTPTRTPARRSRTGGAWPRRTSGRPAARAGRALDRSDRPDPRSAATARTRSLLMLAHAAARCALRRPPAVQGPGIHRRRHADAGARHRRHHRDLQRRQRRAAAAAAVSRARSAGSHVTRSCRSTAASPSRRRPFSTGVSRTTSSSASPHTPRTARRFIVAGRT